MRFAENELAEQDDALGNTNENHDLDSFLKSAENTYGNIYELDFCCLVM